MATVIGKPCVKCGSTERYAGSGKCAPCTRGGAARRDKENPEKARVKRAKYYKEHAGKELVRIKKWREENPQRVREIREANRRKTVSRLTNAYVAAKLGINVKDAQPELIEAKREQMQLKRLIKQLKETLK